MVKQSAGILIYRRNQDVVEVLLAHPGGPFWSRKDTWSIPKGEADEGEDLIAAAQREFEEEMGFKPPSGQFYELGESKQNSGKTNYIWAIEGDVALDQFVCTSTFSIEWPPKSGSRQSFPENDRAEWFSLGDAKKKLFKAQTVFIDRLALFLGVDFSKDVSESPPASLSQQASLF